MEYDGSQTGIEPDTTKDLQSSIGAPMSLSIGDLTVACVSGGHLRLDGGSMFGVVPKALWQRRSAPDDQNRILLATNCLLVRSPTQTVLVDTGYGGKASDRDRQHFALECENVLVNNLAAIGVEPEHIDLVILTHLHFDHAGGCTANDSSGQPVPVFPRARYVIQQHEWDDATADLPELTGNYFKRDFLPLQEAGQLELIDGEAELIPGLTCRLTGGHTRGHQIIHLSSGGHQAIYPADLCPSTAHLRTFWTMAYDQYPLALRRIKPRVLGDAADQQWLVIFDHDPQVQAAYLTRDPKQEFAVRERVAI